MRFSDVHFSYGRKRVLRGVDWELGRGISGLLGPNGSGKTTLISLAVGALPGGGGITVGDAGTSGPNGGASPSLGYVPQSFSLVPGMSVLQTAAYAAWVNGVQRRECEDAARRALGLVDLGGRAGERVRALSGGQRQRLGIAAALAHEPRVLVLDEPTVGLDPAQRLRVREVIAELGQDRTVLLATHLVEDIAYLCRRVGVLVAGRIVFDGTVEELTGLFEDEAPEDGRALGSAFERGYERLVRRWGAGE
ncbi:ABC transporter ATP-binding protein [Actinoalloteichus spitiensis]|uniref:ABC transporter ATP-binding protein n=1 Tax=Actinoalloteichus spitiensis TaxID=252394 RepID=UPI00037B5956|nr:ATP-binding cassette domain-containing protein [Actinoalloteichus spitiensis]